MTRFNRATLLLFLCLALLTFSIYSETFSLLPNNKIVQSDYPGYSYENENIYYSVYFNQYANSGDTVRFYKSGAEIRLQAHSFNYRNSLNQLQQISMPNSNIGTISGTTITYTNLYGSGLSLIYSLNPDNVKETIKINSFSNLPAIQQYMIDGGNPELEINFVLATNAQKITIDGTDWDMASDRITSNQVYIKDSSGNILYWLAKPVVYDSQGNSATGSYFFKKSAQKLYVSIRVPYSFATNPLTIYPIYIDPTFVVDYSPIPAEHLINGSVVSGSDLLFDNISDITAGVSDNLTGTDYEIRLYKLNTQFGTGMVTMNWHFDETSGTAIYDSALGNIGTAYGSPNLTITGVKNTGIKFDGINDYVAVPNNRSEYDLTASEKLVVCFAIKTDGNLPNGDFIIDMKDGGASGWEIQGADDELRFSTDRDGSGNKNLETTFQFNDFNWHTYCGYSGFTQMVSYVDGSLDNTLATTQLGALTTTENYRIGADTDSTDFTQEAIDELCVIKGTDLNITAIAYYYNLTKSCDNLFHDYSEGIAISAHWNLTYNPVYDWFLRLYKTTPGSANITVAPYYDNDSVNMNYSVSKIFDQIGWFNINVSSLMNYQTNILNFTYTNFRFWTNSSHNFSEIFLRSEINDTEPPNITACSINDTQIGCLESVHLHCNVTDNLDVDYVNFTVSSQEYPTSKIIDTYNLILSPTINASIIYSWTNVTACDILGLCSNFSPNITFNYTCIFEDYINITHFGINGTDQVNLTVDYVKITWTTNNPSDSLIYYGLSPTNLSFLEYNSSLVTNHHIDLFNLTPNTTYYYLVNSTVNPSQQSTGFNFTTPALVLYININATNESAEIITSTNPFTNSTIQYGLNDGNWTWIDIDYNYTKFHNQTLLNLTANTTYYVNQTICKNVPTNFCQNYYYNFTTEPNFACISNWTLNSSYNCLVNNTIYHIYYDSNNCLPPSSSPPGDNGTFVYCNYCSENLFYIDTSCGTDLYYNRTWYDGNYSSCCQVTNITSDCSILYSPYNQTQRFYCGISEIEGLNECANLPQFNVKEKEYCLVRIPSNYSSETFKCLSYVKYGDEIIQSNPEYNDKSGSIFGFLSEEETREYFQSHNGLVNFYFTKKNLYPDYDYVLGLKCSSESRIITSEVNLNIDYDDFGFVFSRTLWMKNNSGYILALGLLTIFFIGGGIWILRLSL